MRNDSFNNLLGALTIAGHFNIPETLIFFNNKLFRANRTTIVDSEGLASYSSPNFPIIAELRIFIDVNWNCVLRPDLESQLCVKFLENKNVVLHYFNIRLQKILQNRL